MVNLVDTMLALHKQLAAARTPLEQTALERQIAPTDAQIDRLVYDLYGLTEAATAVASTEPSTPEARPKRVRKKSAFATPPAAPVDASLAPEKAYADAAHHYLIGKEDPTPYRTGEDES